MRTVRLETEPIDDADAPRTTSGTTSGADAVDREPDPMPGGRRLLGHLVALAVVLLALIPVAGTGSVWSADEGALLYQVSSLAESGTDGWTFAHPLPAADPDGTRFPIHLASWAEGQGPTPAAPPDLVTGGEAEAGTGADVDVTPGSGFDPGSGRPYIVLAKHVVYLWLATALFQLGGYPAVIALSALGTAAAAGATARLAGVLDGRASLPALWLTGLASPLFVNSFVAWAHTPTAALAGWSAWFLIDDRGRRRRRLVGCALLAVACLFRTEAPLLGIAMAIGLPLAIVIGGRLRSAGRAIEVGASILVATVGGVLVDRITAENTEGPIEPQGADELFGGLVGRVEGFARTWLAPSYTGDGRDLLLMLSAALLVGAAVMARRIDPSLDGTAASDGATVPDGSTDPAHTERVGLVTVLAGGGAALLLARFALSPIALVPGLLVAFPLLPAGFVVLRGRDLRSVPAGAMGLSFLLFCGAVLATQYRTGGGGEWGGRYFAIGLPLGIALATVGIIRLGDRLQVRDRRRLGAVALTIAALLPLMGLFGVRSVRLSTAELVASVDGSLRPAVEPVDGSADHAESGVGPEPIVVSTVAGAGRWAWDELDRARWLRVDADELPDTIQRLDDLGVDRFVLLTYNPDRDLASLDRFYRTDPQQPSDDERVVAVVRR